MQFIQARNFTPTTGRTIDWIVVHDMEAPEARDTAENVARWGAGPTAPQASWHYGCDSDSVVQSVRDMDVAWHAPGANHNGIGIEHAGYARQTPIQWGDPFSEAMLLVSSNVAADLCKRYDIPVRFVDAAGLRRGDRGITTHAEVTKAFPGPGRTHTDPGTNFPMEHYLALVMFALGTLPKPAPPVPVEEEDPMIQSAQLQADQAATIALAGPAAFAFVASDNYPAAAAHLRVAVLGENGEWRYPLGEDLHLPDDGNGHAAIGPQRRAFGIKPGDQILSVHNAGPNAAGVTVVYG